MLLNKWLAPFGTGRSRALQQNRRVMKPRWAQPMVFCFEGRSCAPTGETLVLSGMGVSPMSEETLSKAKGPGAGPLSSMS